MSGIVYCRLRHICHSHDVAQRTKNGTERQRSTRSKTIRFDASRSACPSTCLTWHGKRTKEHAIPLMCYLIFPWISRQPEGPRDESLDGGNGLPMSLGSRLDQLLSCMGCNRRGSPLSPSSHIIAISRMTAITSPIVRQIPVAIRPLCIVLGTRFDQLKLWCIVNRDLVAGLIFPLSFPQHCLS